MSVYKSGFLRSFKQNKLFPPPNAVCSLSYAMNKRTPREFPISDNLGVCLPSQTVS